jgi:hypothetical protein
MLIIDAWFDVTTSDRHDAAMAILLAVLVELPLAGLCGWIALRVQRQNSATGAG